MTVPVLTFFNNKGGVGKTSLVYHLAWMLAEMDYRVLACDLDPQSNLTAAFLDEESLERLWSSDNRSSVRTVKQCLQPLARVSDIHPTEPEQVTDALRLVPGDLALTGFEDTLPEQWPHALGSNSDALFRSFRILTAFFTLMQGGAKKMEADIILADVGPNLGAINRSALIASDYIIVPLGADLFSLQGLRNLGPTLRRWRQDWGKRREHWEQWEQWEQGEQPDFLLPQGAMRPIGYVVQQYGVRLGRPVQAYDKWVNRMPEEYARQLLGKRSGPYAKTPADDEHNALATMKHYRSLVPMAQEARKPIFNLSPADGAIGSHAAAAADAYDDFKRLAEKIVKRIQIEKGGDCHA